MAETRGARWNEQDTRLIQSPPAGAHRRDTSSEATMEEPMLKRMLVSTVVTFALVGPTNAQESAKQVPDRQHAEKQVLQARTGDPVPRFAANLDRAALTPPPAPLAPGSAEVP
jgi:hypothetical protein